MRRKTAGGVKAGTNKFTEDERDENVVWCSACTAWDSSRTTFGKCDWPDGHDPCPIDATLAIANFDEFETNPKF